MTGSVPGVRMSAVSAMNARHRGADEEAQKSCFNLKLKIQNSTFEKPYILQAKSRAKRPKTEFRTVRTFRLDGLTVPHQKTPWRFQKPYILCG